MKHRENELNKLNLKVEFDHGYVSRPQSTSAFVPRVINTADPNVDRVESVRFMILPTYAGSAVHGWFVICVEMGERFCESGAIHTTVESAKREAIDWVIGDYE